MSVFVDWPGNHAHPSDDSTAWYAVKLTLPGGLLHLSFRGHGPYRFRSDDGSCSTTDGVAPQLMLSYLSSTQNPCLLPFGIQVGRV